MNTAQGVIQSAKKEHEKRQKEEKLNDIAQRKERSQRPDGSEYNDDVLSRGFEECGGQIVASGYEPVEAAGVLVAEIGTAVGRWGR